jgi:hypothetical protein
MIDINRDHDIEILLLTRLDQQRDDVDHNGGRIGGLLQLCCPSTYGWVHDPLEVSAGIRISKDDLSKPRSVELPVTQYLRTEPLDDRG